MKSFVFEGYSDDIFCENFREKIEFCDNGNCTPIQFSLIDKDGSGVIVTGQYTGPNGNGDGWMIGVHAIDDTKPVDHWEFQMKPSYQGYQNQLKVTCPDSVECKLITGSEDE